MNIDYLANYPQFIPELTALLYQEWGMLYRTAGLDAADLQQTLTKRAVTNQLPITLVAVEANQLIASGSIKLGESGTMDGEKPWLGGIYVKAQWRGQGIGTAMVQALEQTALQLGVAELHLSADAAVGFYQNLHWEVLQQASSFGIHDVVVMRKELGQYRS